MEITLEEAKVYLRVDGEEEDGLITVLLSAAQQQCLDVLRLEELPDTEKARAAVFYALAYMYEHREEANYRELMLDLRQLLFGDRQAAF